VSRAGRSIIAAIALAAGLVMAIAVPAAFGQVDPTTASGVGAPPRLTLLDQPIVTEPSGRFSAFVAIEDAPTATELAVDIYDRAAPDDLIGIEPSTGPAATFEVVQLTTDAPAQRRTSGFSIALYTQDQPNPDPAWGWQIDEPGVYPVRVRLLDADGRVLAVLMTAILRLPGPDQTVAPTQAALLVEVHRPPPIDPDDRAAPTAAAGFLGQLRPILAALEARPMVPATISVTPDTLARIAADESAAEDLARLRATLATQDRTVLDAPFVDIDPASLVAEGLSDELTAQRDLGRQTLTELLEPPTSGTWRVEHRVDAPALEALRSRGVLRTLVPGDAMSDGIGVTDPVELPAGDATIRALAVSDLFSVGAAANEDPVLAAHRLLARLAVAGTGRSDPAHVVVDIDPGRATATTLALVLDALRFGTPFFAPTGIDDALGSRPVGRAELAPVSRPDLGTYAEDLRRGRRDLASYGSMVAGRAELLVPFERTLAISAAADLDAAERRRDARSVTAQLEGPFSAISIPATDKVTLGAREARFPLVIESKLEYPVQVVIQLEANSRVEFPNDRIEETLETEREVVQIRVRTRATGDTPVRVSVRTPDDGRILAEGRYVIRSTAVSWLGIVLTAGAGGFLVLWWGRHWYRGRRATPPSTPV